MSKLESLLQELCPDGVEYKKLGDIATISRGGNFQKKDYTETGVPCIHYGQIYTLYNMFVEETVSYIPEETASRQKFAEKNDIVMAVTSENIEDVCKCVSWLGDRPAAISGHAAIIHHAQNPRYMAYYLNSSHFFKQKVKFAHGTKVIEVTPAKLVNIMIPVPPLPVQEEIVRILDQFTQTETELQNKITAEIEARKKQQVFHKNKILNASGELKTLKEISISSRSGGTPLKSKTEYYEGGTIPWLRTQEVVFNEIYKTNCFITEKAVQETSAKWIPENCVIVAISGATAGRCGINKIPLTTNQHCLGIEINHDIALYKYVFYCVHARYEELLEKKQGARGDLNAQKILSLEIPIPTLEKQEKIISELDEFDKSFDTLISNLTAELSARQTQYEYYRDKLLTFKARA